MLRLPHKLATLFPEWLDEHYPLRKRRILKALRSMRGGALDGSGFGARFLGEGARAELIRRRFERACRVRGLAFGREVFTLDRGAFRAPSMPPVQGDQLDLFGGAAPPDSDPLPPLRLP